MGKMTFDEILSNFNDKEILIIGDIILDRYLEGQVSRINPEAPVPIVSLKKEFNELGGAANVASNISSLGGKATLFGFVGRDVQAEFLKKMLQERNIRFFLDDAPITTVKTRVIGGSQQLLRFDKEDTTGKKFSSLSKEKILEEAKKASLILISDYAKGTVTKDLMDLIHPFKYKTIVDPKPQNKLFYKGVYLITPNEKESGEMSGGLDFISAGESLKKELGSNIVITRGDKGMYLSSEKNLEIPTYAREVYDVIGAGDSVIATLALAIAAGASLEEATILANFSAGIKVGKKGTYSVNLEELKEKISFGERKIVSFEELRNRISDLRRKNKKIAWTNGCFDLLHSGHIKYLKEARKLGDFLIVGINSDDSVRKIKGENRPIQSQEERAEILSSLEFVDLVYVFSEPTCERYLSEFKPDYYVKGGDYNLDSINIKERLIVEDYCGQIAFISLVEGKSSSRIVEKIAKIETNKN